MLHITDTTTASFRSAVLNASCPIHRRRGARRQSCFPRYLVVGRRAPVGSWACGITALTSARRQHPPLPGTAPDSCAHETTSATAAPDRATRRSHAHSLALRVRNRSHTHQAARTGSRHATHTITRNTRRTHRQRSAQHEQARCRRCSRAPAPVAHRRHLRQALALSAPHRVPRYSQRSTTGQRRASEFACIPGLCLNPSLPLSLCASCL